jgi:hypothetical protein
MFFSAPTEGDDDRVRIAEDAANGGSGNEARKGVEIVESGELGHAAIVTSFAGREKTKTATKIWEFKASGSRNYPHYSTKSLFF